MEQTPVEEKLRILAGQVYASAKLAMWCYGWDGEFFYSTCPHEATFRDLLEKSGCLSFALEREGGCSVPVFLSTQVGLMWIAEHRYEQDRPALLILMGPFFPSRTSMKSIEHALSDTGMEISVRLPLMRILAEVPFLMLSGVNQYAEMLHYCLTEETISPSDFVMQTPTEETLFKEEEGTPRQMVADADRMMQGEALLLQCVQDGNPDYRAALEAAESLGGLLSDSGNVLRDGKNSVIVLTALCCRAAIKGGLPAWTAKNLEADYFNRVEMCRTIPELKELRGKMLSDFIRRVREVGDMPQVSIAVRQCCDYIRASVTREISLADLAELAGYTEYYFAKKFYKEMGMRVNDFIKEAKINYARILLVTTDKDIQEISDTLHFGNRNYFTKVFRELSGMTPAAYREKTRR